MTGMAGKVMAVGPYGRALADRIRSTREEQGLTYSDLSRALAVDINPVGIRRIENYERRVDVDEMVALADALGAGPMELLGLNGSRSVSAATLRRLQRATRAVLDQLEGDSNVR